MDTTADLVALSGAREKARQLNALGTYQWLLNTLVVRGKGKALTTIDKKAAFDGLNILLRWEENQFGIRVRAVNQLIAHLNGSNLPVVPDKLALNEDPFSSRLRGQRLTVVYIVPDAPPIQQTYPKGFFARLWSPNRTKAQPDHESAWVVCRSDICGRGRAELWLDVEADSFLNNGGFPPERTSLWRSIGFQSFYPQFNARLLPKA